MHEHVYVRVCMYVYVCEYVCVYVYMYSYLLLYLYLLKQSTIYLHTLHLRPGARICKNRKTCKLAQVYFPKFTLLQNPPRSVCYANLHRRREESKSSAIQLRCIASACFAIGATFFRDHCLPSNFAGLTANSPILGAPCQKKGG